MFVKKDLKGGRIQRKLLERQVKVISSSGCTRLKFRSFWRTGCPRPPPEFPWGRSPEGQGSGQPGHPTEVDS